MANGLFDSFRDNCLQNTTSIDIVGDDIQATLIDQGVTVPSLTTHDFYDDLETAHVGPEISLTSKTVAAGIYDAADTILTSVSGASCEGVLLYNNTPAADADKNLICYFDTGTGLPVTPNGGDITIQWSAGADKIFNWKKDNA
jgi:hypothetical protein